MKKTMLVTNHHQDFSGGGQYARQLLSLLSEHYDLVADHSVEIYSKESSAGTVFVPQIREARSEENYDVHLLISHRGVTKPLGVVNVQLCYYPTKKDISGWDLAIVCNDFVARAVESTWNVPSLIIPLYFDEVEFHPLAKVNSCIGIGNYFIENDGHSKNQHLVIDWFKKNCVDLGLDELILHGFSTNDNYFNYLTEIIGGDSRIKLNKNSSREDVRKDLSKSKYLIHANGYQRSKPEQTEHFGMVAVEALLSGVLPIVHNSGGCPEILGVTHFNSFEDLNLIINKKLHGSSEQLRELGLVYSIEKTKKSVSLFVKKVKKLIDDKYNLKKLNIGCGDDYRYDCINLDVGQCKKDVNHDLESYPYPFPDASFSEIISQHVIEHIDRRNFVNHMRELHRILVPGGKILISAPYYLSKNAFTDFTHKNFMTEDSFGYFDPKHQLRQLGKIYGIDFEFSCDWKLSHERTHPEVSIFYELVKIK